jgi:hypothetical protein
VIGVPISVIMVGAELNTAIRMTASTATPAMENRMIF